jgi:hypothetical protein
VIVYGGKDNGGEPSGAAVVTVGNECAPHVKRDAPIRELDDRPRFNG